MTFHSAELTSYGSASVCAVGDLFGVAVAVADGLYLITPAPERRRVCRVCTARLDQLHVCYGHEFGKSVEVVELVPRVCTACTILVCEHV